MSVPWLSRSRLPQKAYREAADEVLERSRQRDPKAAAYAKAELDPVGLSYEKVLTESAAHEKADAAVSANAINSAVKEATLGLLIGLGLTIVIGLLIAGVIVRGISTVLRKVSTALRDGSTQVASAANQVSSSSQSLAEGASQQAASLEETSSSLEEMASMTNRNSENTQKANQLAREARHAAEKGSTDMHSMAAAMESIKAASDEVAKIIKTIDEIAFQTNILALNAAVEAARAGESGMGFAVVADEVRNLAQRSAQAAKETATKIEGAISKTSLGVEISEKVAQALGEIVVKARHVDELVGEVATASREQSQGATQINTAVGQMDKVTQQNAATAEESASAAEELNAQAQSMKVSVDELLQLVDGSAGADSRISRRTLPASILSTTSANTSGRNGRSKAGRVAQTEFQHVGAPSDADFGNI